jgi:hypothetical protein
VVVPEVVVPVAEEEVVVPEVVVPVAEEEVVVPVAEEVVAPVEANVVAEEVVVPVEADAAAEAEVARQADLSKQYRLFRAKVERQEADIREGKEVTSSDAKYTMSHWDRDKEGKIKEYKIEISQELYEDDRQKARVAAQKANDRRRAREARNE